MKQPVWEPSVSSNKLKWLSLYMTFYYVLGLLREGTWGHNPVQFGLSEAQHQDYLASIEKSTRFIYYWRYVKQLTLNTIHPTNYDYIYIKVFTSSLQIRKCLTLQMWSLLDTDFVLVLLGRHVVYFLNITHRGTWAPSTARTGTLSCWPRPWSWSRGCPRAVACPCSPCLLMLLTSSYCHNKPPQSRSCSVLIPPIANARAVHLVPFTSGLEIFEIGYWTDDRKCGVGD